MLLKSCFGARAQGCRKTELWTGSVLGTYSTEKGKMALEIGPNQTALAAQSTSTDRSSATSSSPQALNQATLRTTVEPGGEEATRSTVSPVQAEERQTTGILFNASSSLDQRQDAAENLLGVVEQLRDNAEEIEREVDPNRRQALIDESEALVQQAQADFEAAVEENPSLAENETITAVITPGEDPSSGQTTFTTSLPRGTSPEDLGLPSVNFEDAEAAQETLDDVAGQLRGQVASIESTRSDVATAVRDRGRAIASEEQNERAVDPDSRSEELAQEVAQSASRITEASPVEQLEVQSLLAEEEASVAAEQASIEERDTQEVESSSDDQSSSQSIEGLNNQNEDPATAGNRLVQN